MTTSHTTAEAQESLTELQAQALSIIHITSERPTGKLAPLMPALVSKGFCRNGGGYSRLTDEGYKALLTFIKSKEES